MSADHWNSGKIIYTVSAGKSEYLVRLVSRLRLPSNASILEVGCNVGRNLHYLHRAGYMNLHGVDINGVALDASGEFYPETRMILDLMCGDVSEIIIGYYDLVYTMAVLQHIPCCSVIDNVANAAGKYIIVIEDETTTNLENALFFQRNYREEFEGRGFKQIGVSRPAGQYIRNYLAKYGLGSRWALNLRYKARIFRRQHPSSPVVKMTGGLPSGKGDVDDF